MNRLCKYYHVAQPNANYLCFLRPEELLEIES